MNATQWQAHPIAGVAVKPPEILILTGVCRFLNPRSAPLGAICRRPDLNEYLPLSSEEMRNQREGLNLTAEVPAMWHARLVGQLVVGYA